MTLSYGHVKFTDDDVVAYPEEHVPIPMQVYDDHARREETPPPPSQPRQDSQLFFSTLCSHSQDLVSRAEI